MFGLICFLINLLLIVLIMWYAWSVYSDVKSKYGMMVRNKLALGDLLQRRIRIIESLVRELEPHTQRKELEMAQPVCDYLRTMDGFAQSIHIQHGIVWSDSVIKGLINDVMQYELDTIDACQADIIEDTEIRSQIEDYIGRLNGSIDTFNIAIANVPGIWVATLMSVEPEQPIERRSVDHANNEA